MFIPKRTLTLCLAVVAFVLAPQAVWAQVAAASYAASPDVYKVIAENEHFRVILATWKPGQRDAWHSHAGPLAAYRLTDCKNKAHWPDGKVMESNSKRGSVNFNPIIASHAIENVGDADCQVVIVEKK